MADRRIDLTTLLAAALLLLLAACPPARAGDYIADRGEAARAIGEITASAAATSDVHTIRISGREITLLLRDKARPAVNEWRMRTVRRLFLDIESASGPTPVAAPGVVADLAAGFFPLDAVALDRVGEVAAGALAYARLEGEATVRSIEIARRIHLLPEPGYGEIRWSIYVASPRESATVYADAGGRIVGADLANTVRAQNMDFIADPDWPRDEALADLLAVIGRKPVVRDVTVYPKSLQVKADHPTLNDQTVGYSWTVSGVTRSPVASPLFPGTDKDEAFSLADVDLSALAGVRDAAREAWGNGQSTLNYMMLRRFTEGPGKPELRWTVHFTDIGEPGELALFSNTGTVELSASGEVRVANLPAARRPQRDWLDPATTIEALGTLRQQFGETARFAEIVVSGNGMQILAEVPDAPGTMRDYNASERGIGSSSMMMPWEAEFRPERLYRLDDLAFFTAQKLGELTARTFARLHVGAEMSRSRYTFSIGQLMTPTGDFMVPSPDGKVTLEIRLESPDGWKGGRVTYSSTGEEIDVVMP